MGLECKSLLFDLYWRWQEMSYLEIRFILERRNSKSVSRRRVRMINVWKVWMLDESILDHDQRWCSWKYCSDQSPSSVIGFYWTYFSAAASFRELLGSNSYLTPHSNTILETVQKSSHLHNWFLTFKTPSIVYLRPPLLGWNVYVKWSNFISNLEFFFLNL